jgi:hypothetical protein
MINELEGIMLGGIQKDEMFILTCNGVDANVRYIEIPKTGKQTHPPKQYNNKNQKKW